MTTMNVKNAEGGTEAIEKPLAPGRAAATASRPVVLCTEDADQQDQIKGAIDLTNIALGTLDDATWDGAAPATGISIWRYIGSKIEAIRTLLGSPMQMSGGSVSLVGQGYNASASFTPAAASHVAGDVNGAAAEFASIGPSAGRVMITSASLLIAGGTAEATAWRLYLYDVAPPSAYADDAARDLPSGDRAAYLGYIDLGTAADEGATQWIEVHGLNKQIKLAGTSVFGYLVNLTTLTPANVAHTVTLHSAAM